MEEKLTRFGVSLEPQLLAQFDEAIRKRRYTNRSEAIRDLIRRELVSLESQDADSEVVATITFVFDHHVRGLAERLVELQHDYPGNIIVSTHVHLDHHNCLETLIARGKASQIQDLAHCIQSVKGVKHAALSIATTGEHVH
ncbi:TPA: nickel-responsive transcriptional regulator NikR [Candidatus Sumerlaeota bacterium]|nr:nickel-responsive transcriptional regulator NikR [Candidatus Sumerlaeota bacterium]